MGLFIELRCELRGEGRRHNTCWSDENSGTFESCGDTKKEANLALTELFEAAKAAGWQRWKSGWVCPECIEAAMKQDTQRAAPAQESE